MGLSWGDRVDGEVLVESIMMIIMTDMTILDTHNPITNRVSIVSLFINT